MSSNNNNSMQYNNNNNNSNIDSNNNNNTVVACRLLQRGSMFVFSQSQFQHLLGRGTDWTADTLLDLGIIIVMRTLACCKAKLQGKVYKSTK